VLQTNLVLQDVSELFQSTHNGTCYVFPGLKSPLTRLASCASGNGWPRLWNSSNEMRDKGDMVGIFRSLICLRVSSDRRRSGGGCQRGSWTLSVKNLSKVVRKSPIKLLTIPCISSSSFGVNGIGGIGVESSEWLRGVVAAAEGWFSATSRPGLS